MKSSRDGFAASSLDALAHLAEYVDEMVGTYLKSNPFVLADEHEIVMALTMGGAMQRCVESVLVEAVAAARARSASGDVEQRMTSRYGCHDVSELIQRTTLGSPQTAARLQRASRAVARETSVATGELLPAVLPAMREAMLDGHVGVDGLLAVAAPLADLGRRVCNDDLLAADAALAGAARGEGPDAAPAACADLLKVQATAWAVVLDQDGTEPRDRQALHRRGVTLGAPTDGLVPVHGRLLPEVAAQLQRIFDAVCSPRVEGDTGGVRFRPVADGEAYDNGNGPLDDRRSPQKRHDALATALFAAAASGSLPTIGGAAPTLVVSARESDLRAGRGYAHADGCDEPLSIGAAHHVGCAGVIQRIVLSDDNRVLRIGVEDRVFNRHQRRAIALRDGGCLIPGCGVPAGWCEIHHVDEHARGGTTHTDNGVLLCWFHHRYLDLSSWKIRMTRGVPEVRAPLWNDSSQTWRRVTKSPTRLADLVVRRT